MSAPAHLSDAARAVWAEVTAGMSPEQVGGAEGPAVEAYCVQVARMRDAQARVDSEGLVVADEKGRPMEHPALRIERAAQVEVRAWSTRYEGRSAHAPSPASRRRDFG